MPRPVPPRFYPLSWRERILCGLSVLLGLFMLAWILWTTLGLLLGF